MKKSPSKSWRHKKELLVPRRPSFAKFTGVTILRKKQLGNEKMNSEKTTRTYLLANPNLEGKIHLKGVRLVTSQFLGKEFIKFAHEIMHHFMHSSTLHLHTFSKFCFVFELKPSLYVSNIRREVLQAQSVT
jgi:hypothetical protein